MWIKLLTSLSLSFLTCRVEQLEPLLNSVAGFQREQPVYCPSPQELSDFLPSHHTGSLGRANETISVSESPVWTVKLAVPATDIIVVILVTLFLLYLWESAEP